MKNLLIIIAFLVCGSIHAQSPQYAATMKETLDKMNPWTEAPQTLAATFERIARAEQSQWLPYYYAAYATIIQSFTQQATDLKDKTLDHAQDLLDAVATLHPDSSECLVLQGMLYVARLQAEPMTRGAEFSGKSNAAFDKAIALNAANPRAYYLKGAVVRNTPDFYGGGKAAAKPILTNAMVKYESFKPAYPMAPNWGKQDCEKELAACQ